MTRIAPGVLAAHLLALAPAAAQGPGVTASPTSLNIQEGAAGSYTVVLNTQPTENTTLSALPLSDANSNDQAPSRPGDTATFHTGTRSPGVF